VEASAKQPIFPDTGYRPRVTMRDQRNQLPCKRFINLRFAIKARHPRSIRYERGPRVSTLVTADSKAKRMALDDAIRAAQIMVTTSGMGSSCKPFQLKSG